MIPIEVGVLKIDSLLQDDRQLVLAAILSDRPCWVAEFQVVSVLNHLLHCFKATSCGFSTIDTLFIVKVSCFLVVIVKVFEPHKNFVHLWSNCQY